MAEAMLFELPVLTTAYGGQTDFCTPKTSWLIDFTFQYAKTHMNLKDSLWAVPKKDSLKKQILNIYTLPNKMVEKKCKVAKKYILDNYSSEKVTQNILNAIDNYSSFFSEPKIGLFSTYNTKCGIAVYSHYLISQFIKKVLYFQI